MSGRGYLRVESSSLRFIEQALGIFMPIRFEGNGVDVEAEFADAISISVLITDFLDETPPYSLDAVQIRSRQQHAVKIGCQARHEVRISKSR